MRYILNIDSRIKTPEDFVHKNWNIPKFVNFTGEFSEESAKKFREELEAAEDMALMSQQDIIPVVIDSYGGSVYALLSMIDAIESCKVKIATVVESKAMSCGAVLFAMGAEGYRFMGPNATVMIHPVSSGTFGKVHELKADVKEADRLNNIIFKKMAANCQKSESYFWDLLRLEHNLADWYLDALTCKEHNLANHIKLPSFKVNVSLDYSFGL